MSSSPSLRLVPAVDAVASPVPDAPADRDEQVANTVRCRNPLCRLALVEILRDRTYRLLHPFPIRHDRGTSTVYCTCPACGELREFVLR